MIASGMMCRMMYSNVHKVFLVFKKEQDLHDRKRHDVQDDVL